MAASLRKTLQSVQNFADEVVIVDMNSSDETYDVAKEFSAKIYPYEKDLGFADPARNFALSKATSDWILVLDADEEVPFHLKAYLREVMNESKSAAYFLPRKNFIFGKWIQHTGWWPDYQLRFFKKGEVAWSDTPHTLPTSKSPAEYIPAKENLAVIHQNYTSISQFIDRLNRYTTLEKRHNNETITSSHIVQSFSREFLGRFFAHNGIKDGQHGITLAFLQAFYEVAATAKNWEKQGFKETNEPEKVEKELRVFQKDLNYWLAEYHIKNSHSLEKIYWKIRRKVKL